MRAKRNIAASVGHWSARHRKTAVIGWITFVILAFLIGGKVGTQELTQKQSGVGDSGRAERILDNAYPDKAHEAVLFQSAKYTADDPEFRGAVRDVQHRLQGVHGVVKIGDPYGKINNSVINDSRHSALLAFEIPGDAEKDKAVTTIVDKALAAVKAADEASSQIRIEEFGDASSNSGFEKLVQDDLKKAELFSLPLTLIVLLLTFGTLLAAGVPLVLALTGVLGTFGLIGPISQIAPVEESIKNVVLLIGLAVGVDYSLFYLRRVREERAAGRDKLAAIDAAAATSGRAVLVSGFTVMIAMAGMYLAGAPTFTAWATGTVLVVAVAMIGSLTVLPALLSKMGDRAIKPGRIPGLAFAKRQATKLAIWSRITRVVLRRPKLSAALSAGFLVALAVPAMHMQTGEPGVDTLPSSIPMVQTFKHLDAAFPSETSGMSVVLKGKDLTTASVKAATAKFEAGMAAHRDLLPDKEVSTDLNPNRTVATLEFAIAGDGSDSKSEDALALVRGDLIPNSYGQVPGLEAYADGQTAQDHDFRHTLKSHLPVVMLFVLGVAFMILLVTFRSIVVPVKAIALNMLSVAASYGAMVLVFQHGWFKSVLGFEHTSPIVPWLPLFLFVILFGLSMDYHVFVLSRVKELVDRGHSTDEALERGIAGTAGVVSSAAIVMVGVFGIFGTLSFMFFKQMGVGLAVAVLLDATIVRGVLLPATMKLLGERNWWLPKKLQWLPKVRTEAEVAPAPAAG
jgi:RND superfamily putative drug exporter